MTTKYTIVKIAEIAGVILGGLLLTIILIIVLPEKLWIWFFGFCAGITVHEYVPKILAWIEKKRRKDKSEKTDERMGI